MMENERDEGRKQGPTKRKRKDEVSLPIGFLLGESHWFARGNVC